jgi:hypothetical protein
MSLFWREAAPVAVTQAPAVAALVGYSTNRQLQFIFRLGL